MASLYLHIPFCERKCIYCDFYSIENLLPMEQFVMMLKQEIQMYKDYGAREQCETVFFGGGTPSLLSAKQLATILHTLQTTFSIAEDAEITIEVNPGTVDRQKLKEYQSLGITRLSFGVQSFQEDELKFLGRIHTVDDVVRSVRDAQDVGFENINIDLIFALPSQSIGKWYETLQQAVALGTQHISAYSLIVEEGTPLARMVKANIVTPLPSEEEAEMYEATMIYLAEEGFEHYEVSNYAKRGFASRHNSNYWNYSNYLSFGPSAHSFWSHRRWWNVAHLKTYLERVSRYQFPIEGEEQLERQQILDEMVMLGLRSRGVCFPKVQEETGLDVVAHAKGYLTELIDEGLAVIEHSTLRLTDKGFLLCDTISERLLHFLSPA